MHTCPKCNGKGKLPHHAHIMDGVCFKCDGTGKVEILEHEEKDESCDVIHHLVDRRSDTDVIWAQFCVWNMDETKEKFGTANYSVWRRSLETGDTTIIARANLSLVRCREVYGEYKRGVFTVPTQEDFDHFDRLHERHEDYLKDKAEARYWAS